MNNLLCVIFEHIIITCINFANPRDKEMFQVICYYFRDKNVNAIIQDFLAILGRSKENVDEVDQKLEPLHHVYRCKFILSSDVNFLEDINFHLCKVVVE